MRICLYCTMCYICPPLLNVQNDCHKLCLLQSDYTQTDKHTHTHTHTHTESSRWSGHTNKHTDICGASNLHNSTQLNLSFDLEKRCVPHCVFTTQVSRIHRETRISTSSHALTPHLVFLTLRRDNLSRYMYN